VNLRPLIALLGIVALAAPAPARPDRPTPQQVSAEVDALLAAAWTEAGVRPAPAASEAEWLRRLSLDVEGVVPEERTVAAALAQRLDRAALVKGLVRGQGFARSMSARWSNLLIGRRAVLESDGREDALATWLAQQLAGGAPWDGVVRDLLAPPVERGGPAQYGARYGGRIEEVTGNALRVFQGLPLQCAQCHDHPYHDDWKQTDFWSVAAFLAGGPTVDVPGRPGVSVPRRYLGGERPRDGADGRVELARILCAPANAYFARATVNRVWSFFFGGAFQDPDDLTQAPRLPAVLDRLAVDFRESGHDLRRLCEVILGTRAYGLSSEGPADTKAAQLAVFARARLRPHSPEQLWSSLARATGLDVVPTTGGPDAQERARDRREQLRRDFLRAFGQQDEGEPDQYTQTQALALLNGSLTNVVLRAGPEGSPAMTHILGLPGFDEQLSSLYLRVVGRPPTRAERQALRPQGLSSEEQAQLLSDVFWALLNSSEFVTNH
jgi:hypothetical protein